MLRGHFRIARANREVRATRAVITVGLLAVVTIAVAVGWLISAGAGPSGARGTAAAHPWKTQKGRQAAQVRPAPPPASTAIPGTVPPATVPPSAMLASVLRDTPVYASPGRPGAGTVPATWFGRPSVLPVIATRVGWVEVRLAQRPNGSTAWLPAADVALGSTPYRIVINAARTWLALYNQGRLVFSAPAGVGTTGDPTPPGEYFVAFDEPPPQPNPGYGPFIMVTSAHSPAITDWAGSGDAIIGIHGPLGDDAQIGTTGARVSHGCIRLRDQALEKLSAVPPGTPIDIVS